MQKLSWRLDNTRPLWQLLLDDPSDLTCDECFAVMEYYAEMLAKGRIDLLPEIMEHLKGCPDCEDFCRVCIDENGELMYVPVLADEPLPVWRQEERVIAPRMFRNGKTIH